MSVFRCDRKDRLGGGTALYISNELRNSSFNDPTLNAHPESLWVRIKGVNRDLLIGVIYRPPNSSQDSDEVLMNSLSRVNSLHHMQVVIMGDFNLPTLTVTPVAVTTSIVGRFRECISSAGLHNVVEGPTRWGSSANPSALDLVLVNEDGKIDNLQLHPPLGMSDHCVLSFNIHTNHSSVNKTLVPVKNYKQTDFTQMRNILRQTNWTSILDSIDPNHIWVSIKKRINEVIELTTPEFTPKNESSHDWLKSSTKNCFVVNSLSGIAIHSRETPEIGKFIQKSVIRPLAVYAETDQSIKRL